MIAAHTDSEVIVSDSDTRAFSLFTLAPTGAGATSAWTGTYASVNPVPNNDSNSVYTNTASVTEQFTLTSLPTGVFSIQAVKVTARAELTAGSTPTNLSVGVYSHTTLAAGTSVAQTTAWQENESLLAVNPVTSAAWTQAEISALQVALTSA